MEIFLGFFVVLVDAHHDDLVQLGVVDAVQIAFHSLMPPRIILGVMLICFVVPAVRINILWSPRLALRLYAIVITSFLLDIIIFFCVDVCKQSERNPRVFSFCGFLHHDKFIQDLRLLVG